MSQFPSLAQAIEATLACVCIAAGGYTMLLWGTLLFNWGSVNHITTAIIWTVIASFAVLLMLAFERARDYAEW